MKRLSAKPPQPYNLSLLREQAFARWPQCDVNELYNGEEIAFYFPDDLAPTQGEVDAFLQAHDGRQKSSDELEQERREAVLARLREVPDRLLATLPWGPVIRDLLRYLGLRQ